MRYNGWLGKVCVNVPAQIAAEKAVALSSGKGKKAVQVQEAAANGGNCSTHTRRHRRPYLMPGLEGVYLCIRSVIHETRRFSL